MTKTPEQMALEYAHKNQLYWDGESIDHHIVASKEMAFLAGYKAGQEHPFQFQTKMWVDPIGPQDRWISVKERLPENGIEVLVVSDGETGASWHEAGEFGWAIGGTVTHWMPLPKPPEDV